VCDARNDAIKNFSPAHNSSSFSCANVDNQALKSCTVNYFCSHAFN
jgi:hypothetical protein